MSMNLRESYEAMLNKIKQSGLDEKDAKALEFKNVDVELCKKLKPRFTDRPAAGFLIPYFDTRGKRTAFFRFRYLEEPKRYGFDALVQHKSSRYIQPAKMPPRAYFSRLCDWQDLLNQTGEKAIMITEGELKANCAVKAGLPCIGLGGVWNFKTAQSSLIKDLEDIRWKDAMVYIVYDSDAQSNPQVLLAENTLARELLSRGARVTVVRLPALEKNAKTGLDDFIVAKGAEAVLTLCEETGPWEQSRVLHELNEEVVFIHDPGTVVEVRTLQRMSPQTFQSSIYANRVWEEHVSMKTREKIIKKSAAREWVGWPYRAEVQRTTYRPGKPRIFLNPQGEHELNTWPGWGMNGTTVAKGDIGLWSELVAFLFDGESTDTQKWFLQWLAYPLQHPGTKLFTACVIWSRAQGVGKTLLGYTMERIYGRNFAEITDRDLQSSFNDWAENKQFVMGDEITGGDKRGSADRMKGLITQKFLRINPKFVAPYVVPDCVNYFFTSNHPDSFFLDDNDRRYFIHEVQAAKPLNESFYREYDHWYKSDRVGALFYYLLDLDLTGFNPNACAPSTNAKREMVQLGRSDVSDWCGKLLEAPDSVLRVGDQVLPYSLMTTQELYNLYDPLEKKKITPNGVARELRRAGFRKVFAGEAINTANGLQRLWAVRDLEHWRKRDITRRQIEDAYNKERTAVKLERKEKF